VAKALPTSKAKMALEKRKDAIKSPDDLAAVVRLVLTEAGPAATSHVVFSAGGRRSCTWSARRRRSRGSGAWRTGPTSAGGGWMK
jgi:hypothetical protein